MGRMDSFKFILLSSAVLLVASLGFYFFQKYNLKQLTTDASVCFNRLPKVGELGHAISLKKDELLNDQRRGVMINRYVEERAFEAGLNYNDLRLGKAREEENRREGYLDIRTEITPGGGRRGQQRFDRQKIARFIFLLENRTNLLKVTNLILRDPAPDRESWSMSLEVTERQSLKPEEEGRPGA